jgi:hypothetical protein
MKLKQPDSKKEVPRGFLAELQSIDPDLAVKWSEIRGRWFLMRRRKPGEPPPETGKRDLYEGGWWNYIPYFRVENEDGSFRPLDQRLIVAVGKAYRNGDDPRVVIAAMEKAEKESEREREEKLAGVRERVTDRLHRAIVGKNRVGWSREAENAGSHQG